METVKFIEHGGEKILVLDYSYADAQELAKRIARAEEIIRVHEPATLRVLTRIAGSEYSQGANNLLLEHIAHNRVYVFASAVVGLGHLSKVVPVANRMTGRALQAFDDESEALDWLAAQAVPKQATESPADAVAVRFVSYLDVEILEIDFRGCGGAELLRRVEIAARTIRSRPERSVLTLTFVHGIRYEKATTVAIREYVRLNKPFVRASAVVGLDWLKQIILPLNRLTGRSIKSFDEVSEAMDWLAAEGKRP